MPRTRSRHSTSPPDTRGERGAERDPRLGDDPDDGIEQLDHVDRLRAQWARELPDVDTSPMALLGRVHRAARLAAPPIEALFAEFGLDRPGFDVLATLRRAGHPYRLSPTALYRSLMASSGGMTHRLARLEERGLVRRRPDRDDGRGLLVELTSAGAVLVERAFRADMQLEARLTLGLSTDQRASLVDGLRALVLLLEATGKTDASTPT